MLNIAVVDDDLQICAQLKAEILSVLEDTGQSASIKTFPCAQDFLNSGEQFHLLFLDIQMEGMD